MGRYEEAEQKTAEVEQLAREVKERLEPYQRHQDPIWSFLMDMRARYAEALQRRAQHG